MSDLKQIEAALHQRCADHDKRIVIWNDPNREFTKLTADRQLQGVCRDLRRIRIQKEQGKLKKQQAELAVFEEKPRCHADQRIAINLDDGIKLNCGKPGDVLAETTALTGEKDTK